MLPLLLTQRMFGPSTCAHNYMSLRFALFVRISYLKGKEFSTSMVGAQEDTNQELTHANNFLKPGHSAKSFV